jgi:ERF superfamily
MANINEVAILEELQKINKKLDLQASLLQARPQTERKELTAALAAAQAEFSVARPRKENPYYKTKYETLADLINASRDALCKNGLSVSFPMSPGIDDAEMITCLLSHSSGQELQSSIRLMQHRGDPRARVSEIEYLKRMLYSALIGVVADDDDDADKAMRNHRVDGEGKEKEAPKPRELERYITKEQLDILRDELKTCPDKDLTRKLLEELGIEYLTDTPSTRFKWAYDEIKRVKNLYASLKGFEE